MIPKTKEQTIELFVYKAPNEETAPNHERVNDLFLAWVDALYDVTPDGPGKTYAFRKLAEARMAFHSAIANGGE